MGHCQSVPSLHNGLPSKGGLMRSSSAQAFTDIGSDFGGSQTSCLPRQTSRSPSPNEMRGVRRTQHSSSMQSGDKMREALTSSQSSFVRRQHSVPPRLGKVDDDCNSSVASWSLCTDRSTPTKDGGGVGALLKGQFVQSARGSRDGASARLGFQRAVSSTALDDLRARPHRRSTSRLESIASASDMGGSCISMRSRSASPRGTSRACSEDHLWRELFHDEVEDRKVGRNHGPGKVIAARGKSSVGMPWRQIPRYDKSGIMHETGDPHAHQAARSSVPFTSKRPGQFSPRINGAYGVKDIFLAPVSEHNENDPPPANAVNSPALELPIGQRSAPQSAPQDGKAREEWLSLVSRRYAARCGRPLPETPVTTRARSGYASSVASTGVGTTASAVSPAPSAAGVACHHPVQKPSPTAPSEADASPSEAAESVRSRPLHQSHRQQKKQPSLVQSEDSCPYHREEPIAANRKIQPPTPNKRRVLSPSNNLKGPLTTEPAAPSTPLSGPGQGSKRIADFMDSCGNINHSGVAVQQARRDWQYSQDKAVVYEQMPRYEAPARNPYPATMTEAQSPQSCKSPCSPASSQYSPASRPRAATAQRQERRAATAPEQARGSDGVRRWK